MHESVLLNEAIDNLNLQEDSIIVDCTLGYAGHSSQILKRIKKGFLFAFDKDNSAIEASTEKLKQIGNNFEIIKSDFRNIKDELEKRNIKKVDGILFDLGVSSPQLDNSERGFSYRADAKLDMRMNRDQRLSAYEVINEYSYEKLIEILFRYGEEKYAKNIAKNIIRYRETKKIETTLELVEIIKEAYPFKERKDKHPAKKTFQALRIEVNDELGALRVALEEAIGLLNKNGRICVITFHSLEDKICKEVFKKYAEVDKKFKSLPLIPEKYQPILNLLGKIKPSKEEIEKNNRSRSATLRVASRR